VSSCSVTASRSASVFCALADAESNSTGTIGRYKEIDLATVISVAVGAMMTILDEQMQQDEREHTTHEMRREKDTQSKFPPDSSPHDLTILPY
jgi:mannitol-specific phosphotransferase system IIBC component